MHILAGVDENVTVTHRDVCQDGFRLTNVADAVFLDLPKPWEVIPSAKQAIKLTGMYYSSGFGPSKIIIHSLLLIQHFHLSALKKNTSGGIVSVMALLSVSLFMCKLFKVKTSVSNYLQC